MSPWKNLGFLFFNQHLENLKQIQSHLGQASSELFCAFQAGMELIPSTPKSQEIKKNINHFLESLLPRLSALSLKNQNQSGSKSDFLEAIIKAIDEEIIEVCELHQPENQYKIEVLQEIKETLKNKIL